MTARIQQEDRQNLGAKKFNMWIFIFTSFMLFAALTSGFIVYSGQRSRAGCNYAQGVFIQHYYTCHQQHYAGCGLEGGKAAEFYQTAAIFVDHLFFRDSFFCNADICLVCVGLQNEYSFCRTKRLAVVYLRI